MDFIFAGYTIHCVGLANTNDSCVEDDPVAKKKDSGQSVSIDRHKGVNVNIWVPKELKEAIFQSAKKNFRPLTQEIIVAIVEYLERQGVYDRDA